ncbi:MAG TPA: serine/threonine-protein kinase [Solirubrobacteraceae bacterium]|nr:serine/threonine-protein kinase [Solirubrobacteraceae bacterium]
MAERTPQQLVNAAPPPVGPVSPAESGSWEFEEGASIAPGRFVLKRLGGPSELYDSYLVWDERRFAIVVAKVLRRDKVGTGSAHRGLKREAHALRRLQHPVVVRAFDVVSTGPYPHVLLEHLEGFTLRSTVHRQGPLPLEQILPLALHVASALHYFATEGYVHLDVKPANIIMGVPPRLIDLSVARSERDCRSIKRPIGTDAYMAPEQCLAGQGGPPIGPAADVFGLAATLHFACTKADPFPRPAKDERYTLADRFPQIEDDPMPLPPTVPKPLQQIIIQGLRRDPQDRPTASELAMALQPLVAELPHRFILTKSGWDVRTSKR